MRNVDYDKDWSQATRILGIKAQCESEGISVKTVVNSFSVAKPTPRIASVLNMNDGFVYSICRTRIMNDKPSSVEYTYMPISVIPGLSTEVLEDSIYNYIENRLGLSIDSAHSIIRAALPNEKEKKWLKIPSGYPLLEVEQVAFLSDGTAFEFSTTRNTRENGEVRTIRLHRKDRSNPFGVHRFEWTIVHQSPTPARLFNNVSDRGTPITFSFNNPNGSRGSGYPRYE